MAARRRATVEAVFDELRLAANAPSGDPDARATIAAGLADARVAVVRRAAEIAGERDERDLGDALAESFLRLVGRDGPKDPGAAAKTAIVDAMTRLETRRDDVYRVAMRIRQVEGTTDVAARLRGLAGHGLLRGHDPNALREVIPMLFDPEPDTRGEAALAIGAAAFVTEAEMVLRTKVHAGDANADVLGSCFRGLLACAPERSVPLVASFVEDRREDVAQVAALALGETRHESAFDALVAAAARTVDARPTVLLSIALLRDGRATAWLLERVATGPDDLAREALVALAVHRHDEALTERVRATLAARPSRALDATFAARFDGKK